MNVLYKHGKYSNAYIFRIYVVQSSILVNWTWADTARCMTYLLFTFIYIADLKVDVHHKDSSGSEEGTLKPQERENQGQSKVNHDTLEKATSRPSAGEETQNELLQKDIHRTGQTI